MARIKLSKIQEEVMGWLEAGKVGRGGSAGGGIEIFYRIRCNANTMNALIKKGLVKKLGGQPTWIYVATSNKEWAKRYKQINKDF